MYTYAHVNLIKHVEWNFFLTTKHYFVINDIDPFIHMMRDL